MFYLNLDEIPELQKQIPLLRSYYQFRDSDHLPGIGKPGASLKERSLTLLSDHGIELGDKPSIILLAHLRILGYVFNPVSFYFCFDKQGSCRAAIAEVENTFGEKKAYIIPPESKGGSSEQLHVVETKFFYVSPFSDLNTRFDFRLQIPQDDLHVAVNTLTADSHLETDSNDDDKTTSKVLVSLLQGKRTPLTQSHLYRVTWHYPLMTLKVIGLIHWHALQLALKKIPFHLKSANPSSQRGLLNPNPEKF
jgi:DUF1365 family protein